MTTFTTVGYGDYTGKTSPEYVISIVFEMIGIVFSAFLVGILSTSFIPKMTYSQSLTLKLADVDLWLNEIEKANHGNSNFRAKHLTALCYYNIQEFIADALRFDNNTIIEEYDFY